MIKHFSRHHPVIADGEFHIGVFAQYEEVKATFRQAEKRADHYFDPGADVCFLGLLQFLIRATTCAGRLDDIVDRFSQKCGYLPFNCGKAARTRNQFSTDVLKLIKIWMTRNNQAGRHRHSQVFFSPYEDEDDPYLGAMEA